MKTIYKRQYDNPLKEDGTEKENELLGTFEVTKQIFEDSYSEEFIGIRQEDGKKYLVRGDEVSGYYYPTMGGIRYTITEI